jgi:hypothetical protein
MDDVAASSENMVAMKIMANQDFLHSEELGVKCLPVHVHLMRRTLCKGV